jgi:hypothetical protein
MTPLERPVPASVYLIADNLDAALAAGEDLLRQSHDYESVHLASTFAPALAAGSERGFVELVRALEMTICARVLQIRDRSRELAKEDPRFKPMASLFSSGTAALWDAVADLGDRTNTDFQTGDDVVTYLRSRAILAADAGTVSRFGRLSPTETFLVAERIELGVLMDLCATYLDRLEDFYELFADDAAAMIIRDDIVVGIAAARSAAKSVLTAAIHPAAGETAQ